MLENSVPEQLTMLAKVSARYHVLVNVASLYPAFCVTFLIMFWNTKNEKREGRRAGGGMGRWRGEGQRKIDGEQCNALSDY